ncbi:MAG: hypothetical protein RJA22_2431 [Verrucomicrobiota bacterium]|jgi:hypothetical protein
MNPFLRCPAALPLAAVLTLAPVFAPSLGAAETPDPAPPAGWPTREQLREQLKDLTPEQRQAKLKEMRERLGPPGGLSGPLFEKRRAEFEKFRQELQSLPPAERAARLQAWRQTNGLGTNSLLGPIPPGLNPADSEAKRGQFRERIQAELEQLKAKKAGGTLTPEETRRLERMTVWAEQLKSSPDGRPPGPGRRPKMEEQFPKPVEPAPTPAPAPSGR